MKSWTTKNVIVTEIPFDHDLHEFEVSTLSGVRLGVVTPASLENMGEIIVALDGGSCPIADRWEDGNGNTCTLAGWDD